MHVYKENKNRSVVLDESGPLPRVLKRFHHQSRWGALFDPARARGEFRMLQRLENMGLPVPEPLELNPDDASPGFSMRAVVGSSSLEALFFQPGPSAHWKALMERLGQLLARLQGLGVEHADPHPGNILVDPKGQVFLIDPRGTRIRRRQAPGAQCIRDLVAAEAEARDFLPAHLRLRFLAAWKRARPEQAELDLARITQAARLRRRAYVEHGAGRWVRGSSRCSVELGQGQRTYLAKLNPGFRIEPLGAGEQRILLRGSPEELRQTWLNTARCVEHRLPVVWPLELECKRSEASATYAVASAPGVALKSNSEECLRALASAFQERGLRLDAAQAKDLIQVQGGGYLLAPPRNLINLP